MKLTGSWLPCLAGLLLASSLQAQPPQLTPRQYEQLTLLGDALQDEALDQVFDLGYPLFERPRGNSEQQAFIRAFAARVLAQAYQQKDDLSAAAGVLQGALQAADSLDVQTGQALRWQLIQVQVGQADYASALQQLELWWQNEDHPQADAIYLRSALLAQLERWVAAESWILEALEQNTSAPDSWQALAVAIFQQQEKWVEAAHHQSIRLELNPERPRLWNQLAQLQHLAGQSEEALVTRELAQRRGYLSAREQEALARELLSEGQPFRAAKVLEKLLENSEKENLDRLRFAAQAWLQASQAEEAAMALERLAEKSQSKEDWRRLGDWHYSQGNWQQAINAWTQLRPQLEAEGRAEVELLIANALIDLENYSQARQLLEELLESSQETAARQWINYLDALE